MRERFADPDGRVRATFEIVWLSGWAPHESQQQPLKPGSARTRLADALGTRERRRARRRANDFAEFGHLNKSVDGRLLRLTPWAFGVRPGRTFELPSSRRPSTPPMALPDLVSSEQVSPSRCGGIPESAISGAIRSGLVPSITGSFEFLRGFPGVRVAIWSSLHVHPAHRPAGGKIRKRSSLPGR